jgi:hypothetical protein
MYLVRHPKKITVLEAATASFGLKKNNVIRIVTMIPPPPIPAAFQKAMVIASRIAPINSVHSIGNTFL